MPRFANPFAQAGRYPTDPSYAMLGQTLATALFGDPQARAEQELQNARIADAEASARASNAQADSRNLVMKARGNLPGVLAPIFAHRPAAAAVPETAMVAPAADVPAPSPLAAAVMPAEAPAFGAGQQLALDDHHNEYPVRPGARPLSTALIPSVSKGVADAAAPPAGAGGPAPQEARPVAPEVSALADAVGIPVETFQEHLPEIVGALVQANEGGHVDQILRALAGFSGNDATARAGLIAGGATPGKDFAITPQRADDIRRQGYDQQGNIEHIRSGDRRYSVDTGARTARRGQDIRSGDTRRGQDISSSDRRYSTDTGASTSRRGQDIASSDRRYAHDVAPGTVRPVENAATVARQVFPGVEITQNHRDPNSALGRANPGSWHNRSGAAIDVRRIPGVTFSQYVQRYRDAGYEIIEQRDEYANPSPHATGGHWHLVLGERNAANAGAGRSGGRASQPRAVSRSTLKAIDEEVDRRIAGAGAGGSGGSVTAQARNVLRRIATEHYQRSGNPVTAVDQAYREMLRTADGGTPTPARRGWQRMGPAARPAAAPARRIRYDANGNRVG